MSAEREAIHSLFGMMQTQNWINLSLLVAVVACYVRSGRSKS